MAYQPKSYKKFVATAATATLVASAIAPAASAAFSDVSDRYKEAVDYLSTKGISQGYPNGKFGTDDNIKRQDAAVMIAKALGATSTGNYANAGFTDVPEDRQWAVNFLVEKKIVSGKAAAQFGANDFTTRGEMAKIIANAYNFVGDATNAFPFTDVSDTFKQYVDALNEAGVAQGLTATQFGTGDNVTRGQFALFVHRAETYNVTPEVVSVSSANATQVVVKFSTAVDAASLFANDENGAFDANATVTLTSLDGVPAGTLSGDLSADGKTLTITSQNPLSKRYDVVVNGLTTEKGATIAKYSQMVSFAADATAPVISATTKLSAGSFKVTFTEPMKSLGNVTYKLADGTVVSATATGVTNNFAPGADEVTFNLGTDVAANKEVVVTFVGAQDQAGNLLTPNPATVSFIKGSPDGVAPTISSISQTGATKFAVKFSEELLTAPTVTVNNAATTVVKDSADATKYIVTAPAVLDGVTNVAVSNITDLSGQSASASNHVVTFVKDTAAPKVASSTVVVDDSNKKEYLEIAFDKDVVLGNLPTVDATSGSYVKDFVTTNLSDANITPTAISYKSGSKNVVRVELDALLGANDVKGATYSLNLAFASVATPAGIAAETAKTSFTRGEDGAPTSTAVATVTSVVQDAADNNKVNVTFDMAVDGASAINTSNYKIDGAIVESVTLLPVAAGGSQVAVLNLKADSNGFTGTRNINIANVKALGSTKVMNPFFTNSVSLKENVAPTVTSAKLTATNQVTLTFTEAVANPTANNDLELYIGGLKVETNDTVQTPIADGVTSLVLTLEANVTSADLTKGLALKGLSTLDIKDASGNLVRLPSTVNVSQ